jgi:hypothetical protein
MKKYTSLKLQLHNYAKTERPLFALSGIMKSCQLP